MAKQHIEDIEAYSKIEISHVHLREIKFDFIPG